MTRATRTDNWFTRRVMRLTCFERRAMNSAKHAQLTVRVATKLLERVNLPPRPMCLEVGCGQGALARLLVERYNARVVATDYDLAQIALARERLADLDGQVEFRVVDSRVMPFEEGATFDAVFSFGVLHHIPNGWRLAVAEVARMLKPGGWFVFTDLVLSPRVGRLMTRVLPRSDLLHETALHASLAESGLCLDYYAYDPAEAMAVLGLMNYCTATARKADLGKTEDTC